MNQSFEEQLMTVARKTTLGEGRKKAIEHELLLFMDGTSPVIAAKVSRHDTAHASLFANFFRPMPIFATLLMVALIGGGTSFAAERALPGDALYRVKIHVNEEVKSALSFSSESKADWDASRAERRLEETADLAANGKLNAETQIILEENFQRHTDRVEERITEMLEKDQQAAASVASRFETSLKAHDRILERIGEARINVRSHVEPIEIKVGTALRDIGKVRMQIESDIATNDGKPETKAAAEAKLKAATTVIASIRAFMEKNKPRLSAEVSANAEVIIAQAEELVVQGKLKIEAGLFGEAFNLGNNAIRTAEEVRLLAKAAVRFNDRGEAENERKNDSDGPPKKDGTKKKSSDEDESDEESEDDRRPSATPAVSVKINDDAELESDLEELETEIHESGNIDIRFGL